MEGKADMMETSAVTSSRRMDMEISPKSPAAIFETILVGQRHADRLAQRCRLGQSYCRVSPLRTAFDAYGRETRLSDRHGDLSADALGPRQGGVCIQHRG